MSGKPAIHVCVDVDYCGKVYENANYVQGNTVEEAYLRWVPAFGAKPNKSRKASIHMTLQLQDGSSLEAGTEDKFPSAADRVIFTSSANWVSGCSICARLAGAQDEANVENHRISLDIGDKDLLQYHRSGCSPEDMSSDAAASAAAEALLAAAELSASKGKKSGRARKRASKKAASAMETHADGADQEEDVLEDDENEDEQADDEPPLACADHDEDVEEVQRSPKSSGSSFVAALPEVDANTVDVGNAGVRQAAPPSTWRIQSEHSRSLDFGDDDEDPDLHTVVEQLAGVVRNLATTVREESTNLAQLREIVATDHAALQQHLLEARQDRKVMLQLLNVLASSGSHGPFRESPNAALSSGNVEAVKSAQATNIHGY